MTSDPIWLQEDYVDRVSRIGSTPLCIMYKLLEIAYMSYIYTQSNIHTRGSYFFSKMKDICLEIKTKITQQPLFFFKFGSFVVREEPNSIMPEIDSTHSSKDQKLFQHIIRSHVTFFATVNFLCSVLTCSTHPSGKFFNSKLRPV